MFFPRAVARFAAYSGRKMLEIECAASHGGCAMTAKAVSRFVAFDVAPGCFFQAWRRIQRVSNGPVQPVNAPVVTYAPFPQPAIVPKHVRLRHMRISESIEYGLTERFFAIANAIDALMAVADNLVRIIRRL